MPSQAPWIAGFRNAIRASTAEGWVVRNHRERMRLEVRPPGQPMQSVALPFDWAKGATGDAIARVRNIYALVGQGHSVKQAATIAAGFAPLAYINWPNAADTFKVQKMEHGNIIATETWERQYEPVISMAVGLLTSADPPAAPADLIDATIRDWKPGSRMRQVRARSLAQFLRHAVNRCRVPAHWLPPADLRDHIGRPTPSSLPDQKGSPLTDQQILNLIESFPDDDAGHRWADAVRIMAELGLRPVELCHLSARPDPITREPGWWVSYRKRSGAGATEPRRVHPLPLVDADGQVQQWNLLLRWQAGLVELPPLASGNGAGDAIATYLNRRPEWKALRAELAARGGNCVPYSFRHSYSLRGHQRGIDAGSMALSMGHSLEVHVRSYAWASTSGTASAFARAHAALVP